MPIESPEQARLVDALARERTSLANERTLLAWVRTGLGFAAASAVLFRLSGSSTDRALAAASAAVALVLFATGGWRYWTVRRRIARLGPPG